VIWAVSYSHWSSGHVSDSSLWGGGSMEDGDNEIWGSEEEDSGCLTVILEGVVLLFVIAVLALGIVVLFP